MFCPRCGKVVAKDARFCASCGAPIESKPEAAPEDKVTETIGITSQPTPATPSQDTPQSYRKRKNPLSK